MACFLLVIVKAGFHHYPYNRKKYQLCGKALMINHVKFLKSQKGILNKFEKEEPILRLLRKEYEFANMKGPGLSGVCEIVSRLWNIKYNEKMKSKNNVKLDQDEPIFWRGLEGFDFSSDFVSFLFTFCYSYIL